MVLGMSEPSYYHNNKINPQEALCREKLKS